MKEEICIHFSALKKKPVQWASNTFYAILSNDGESVTCYITSKTGEPKMVTSEEPLVFENLNFNSEKHTIAKIGLNDIEETVTSFEKFELNGTDLQTEFKKEDGTKQVITVDLSSLADKNYVHTQAISSNNWVCNHNLNKQPSVTVIDTAGSEVTGEVIHNNLNQTIIKFNHPFSGQAFFN